MFGVLVARASLDRFVVVEGLVVVSVIFDGFVFGSVCVWLDK